MLRKVLPYSIINGVLTSIACLIVFFLTPNQIQVPESDILVVIVLISLGFWFFTQIPYAYSIEISKQQNKILIFSAIIFIIILYILFVIPLLANFFGLTMPTLISLIYTLGVIIIFGIAQYFIIHKRIPNLIFNKIKFK